MQYRCVQIVVILFIAYLVSSVQAAEKSPVSSLTGAIVGEVRELDNDESIGWAVLLLEEIDRSVSAHEDGSYHFFEVPAGRYTLKAFRIGYLDYKTKIQVYADSTTQKTVMMMHNKMELENIIVEADHYADRFELQKPEIDVSGKKLRQNLGRTIAETVDNEPGIAQRSMGPAPARPVMRGMGGDRLLIVEDGERVGDLSANSADHAVAIEPMTTERIEVIRGPASLKFGSNSLGGVINVVRNYIPTDKPHRLTLTASLQGETVNQGLSGGMSLEAPLGTLGMHVDVSHRLAGDMQTPEGDLPNTDIRTSNGSVGLSYIKPWGYAGIAGGYYETEYGIPPDPLGGHPGGVDIDLRRQHVEAKSAFYPGKPWFRRIQMHYSWSRYYHAEYEANGDLGIDYGLISQYFKAQVNLCWLKFFNNCDYGLWGSHRDFATGGLSFTPDTGERHLAGYFYTEFEALNAKFNTIVRYDIKEISPELRKRSPGVGLIRKRNFQGISGGISGRYRFGGNFTTGATIIRSFRAPQIEELFSEGPHLAAYSFDIGNADLTYETGIGLEALFRYETNSGTWQINLFQNVIDNFIYPANTGERSFYRDDLFVYRYQGLDAVMNGIEFLMDWNIYRNWSIRSSMSYIHGQLKDQNKAMPYIPPFSQKISLDYRAHSFAVSARMRSAYEQDRLGKNENLVPDVNPDGSLKTDNQGDMIFISKPSKGFAVFDLNFEYYLQTGNFLSTFNLAVENITNNVYRRHLNRVKEIMPEPGRNLKLLYKIYF